MTLVLTSLVTTVALLLAISAPPPVQAQTKPQGASIQDVGDGQSVSGVRNSNETWGPGTITVTGDISIAVETVVTVTQGTTIQMAIVDGANLGIDASRIEYIVNGTLRVNGPVTFTSMDHRVGGVIPIYEWKDGAFTPVERVDLKRRWPEKWQNEWIGW